jgi:hypothetical protein
MLLRRYHEDEPDPEPDTEPDTNAPQATPAGRSRTRKKNDQEVTADASN